MEAMACGSAGGAVSGALNDAGSQILDNVYDGGWSSWNHNFSWKHVEQAALVGGAEGAFASAITTDLTTALRTRS
jgi:hypothetical protein